MSHDPVDRFRVGLVSCFHETNTFAQCITDEAAFRRRIGWLDGAELREAFLGTRTVVGGMLDGAADADLDVTPIFGALATPAGMVVSETFERIVARITEGLQRSQPLEGLLLELHGAMVVDGDHDPETTLLRAIRAQVGATPVVAVTDMHANMTSSRTQLLDGLVGYRTNPHVDTHESGSAAAGHLARLLRERRGTRLVHGSVPVLCPPNVQTSSEPPLLGLLAAAQELERRHGFLDVSVHAGFSFADVHHAGLSFTVTAFDEAGDVEAARATVQTLGRLAWQHVEEFRQELGSASEAIADAVSGEQSGGPAVVADTGDNINGGAPGDATWLLSEALNHRVGRVGTTLWDPASVQEASEAGLGGRFTARLGGHGGRLSGEPIHGPAEVLWLGDGEFRNTGPMAAGARVTMGPTAVVRVGAADIILQSSAVQPNDPEMFRSVGLETGDYSLVLLKGAAALQAGWGPVARRFVMAGTSGVTDCDLTRLPFRHLRPVWPLHPGLAAREPVEMPLDEF